MTRVLLAQSLTPLLLILPTVLLGTTDNRTSERHSFNRLCGRDVHATVDDSPDWQQAVLALLAASCGLSGATQQPHHTLHAEIPPIR